jgi:hypothetical protein
MVFDIPRGGANLSALILLMADYQLFNYVRGVHGGEREHLACGRCHPHHSTPQKKPPQLGRLNLKPCFVKI